MGKKIIIVLIALVAVILLVTYLAERGKRREEGVPGLQEVPEETRSVTLYYASTTADKLVTEEREIAVGEDMESQVRAVIKELVKGPEGGGRVSSIPPDTELLQAFWVEESQTLFLDFNRAFVSKHPGGSAGEYYTISMVVKTVGANFPAVRRVQFLVDGYQVETIAGHYAVDKPIDVHRWR
jgi:germination protein M